MASQFEQQEGESGAAWHRRLKGLRNGLELAFRVAKEKAGDDSRRRLIGASALAAVGGDKKALERIMGQSGVKLAELGAEGEE